MKTSQAVFWIIHGTLCCWLTAGAAPIEPGVIRPEYLAILPNGDVSALAGALDQGASPRALDDAGNTPLILAAVYGDAACLRLLLDRGLRFLLESQLDDGTWYTRRRAFPFQPTMNSGFPHGRDSWISTAATSWAVLALSTAQDGSGQEARR